MGRLQWDNTGEREYRNGVDHGVLYPYNTTTKQYEKGVVWNGLTAVNHSPTGAEPSELWADNIKYATLYSTEDFGFSIEAFMSPKQFDECDGTATLIPGVKIGQQKRKPFGFVHRTNIGTDLDPEAGYELHLIYMARAGVSERQNATVNDSPDASPLSWECTTTPINMPGDLKPAAKITIDSRTVDSTKLKALEDMLFGVDADPTASIEESDPTLPDPLTVLETLGWTPTEPDDDDEEEEGTH